MIGRLLGTPLPAPAEVAGELEPGVVLRSGRWITRIGGWLAGSRHPAAAVALADTIVVHPDVRLTRRLVRHEMEHVRQWRRNPLAFPLRYAWLHLRHGYRANPYEVAARAAEQEYGAGPGRPPDHGGGNGPANRHD
jgi:hypothetical protein